MLTVPEAAVRVGRDPETVRRWIRAGKLTAWKIGTQHVIDEDDLALLVGPANLLAPNPNQPASHSSESEIVTALHRSRAERAHRISEAVATYRSEHEISTSGPATGEAWLPTIVGRIVHEVDPARIILFGSRGRGDARHDSDFDLLVVLDSISDRRATRIGIRRVLDDLPIAKDIIVATTDEVDGRHGRPRGVLHWALAEGRVLYQRV
jgi:DNA binding domain, excisionase family